MYRGALRRFAPVALLALVPILSTCSAPPRRPNVLWIVWDTVRADHLGLYGYERETTPNLDAWAAGARVFDDCLSTAGYTLPSHAAMFTGLLPSENCAHNDFPRLDGSFTTIAELLKGAGYRTYLYSANPNISSSGGFDQGFDVAEHPWSPRFAAEAARIVREKLPEEDRSSELRPRFEREARGEGRLSKWNIKAAGELAEEALLSWLGASDAERPFLAFVNYMEAHRPLVPPREYRERMMTPEQVQRSFAVDRSWLATWEYTFGLREYDTEEIELTRATYDAALAELDDLFGHLMATLERDGRLEETIVIVTSDHGEHLGEQHLLDHQYSVYEPLLRVPLIVHYPTRLPAGRESRPVSNFDLFPTLLELTGVAAPEGLDSKATSLLAPTRERVRFAEDPAPASTPLAMVRNEHPEWDPTPWQRRLQTVVAGDHKLIIGSDASVELFDLAADPLETIDLATDGNPLVPPLEQALQEFRDSLRLCTPAENAPPQMSPEQIERLKSLGYLGG